MRKTWFRWSQGNEVNGNTKQNEFLMTLKGGMMRRIKRSSRLKKETWKV